MIKMSNYDTDNDFFNEALPKYKEINDSTEILFDDLIEIASNPQFKMSKEQLETFKEMVANTIYYHYTVLYSPLNTNADLQ